MLETHLSLPATPTMYAIAKIQQIHKYSGIYPLHRFFSFRFLLMIKNHSNILITIQFQIMIHGIHFQTHWSQNKW